MTYSIKQLTDNSWILLENQNRLAVLTKNIQGKIQVLGNIEKKLFDTLSDVETHLGSKFEIEETVIQSQEIEKIRGYPIKHTAVSEVDSTELPLYKKGNVVYTAGYYGIKFDHGWSASYCPKLLTLNSHEYIGPFTTKLEMQNSISQKKRITDI